MTEIAEAIRDAPGPMSDGNQHSLGTRLVGVAGYVERLKRGESAELRRLRQDASRIPPEVFWRIVERYEIHPADEPFWMAVLPLMVRHPHARGRNPGHVLEAAGISSARLERWLRLGQDAALREADRLLSRVKEPIDWVQFGFLLHTWSDLNRRKLARDFFLVPGRRTATSSNLGGE